MKLASIDVGLKRIGVAICLTSNIVTPQPAIIRKNRNQAATDVNTFLKEWEIEKLIVGFPSSSIDMQNRINHFISLLEFIFGISIRNPNFKKDQDPLRKSASNWVCS